MKLGSWRTLYFQTTLFKKLFKNIKIKKAFSCTSLKEYTRINTNPYLIKTRSSYVAPFLLNSIIYVHTGNKYKRIEINGFMLGKKLGELSPTRRVFDKGKDSSYKKKRKRGSLRVLSRRKNYLSKKKYRVRSITSLYFYDK